MSSTTELLVNTYTEFWQNSASTASLTGGGYVVTWHSIDQDGSSYGVYMQIYNSSNTKVSGEIQVNDYINSFQMYPEAAGLANGNFVIVWDSFGQFSPTTTSVVAQIYSANSAQIGSEINVSTNYYGSHPSIAALTSGGFVVTWTYGSIGDWGDIYGQLYSSDGTAIGEEFRVNSYTGYEQGYASQQDESSVASLASGGFVVTWYSLEQDGSSAGVFAQIYDSNGNKVGDEFQVNTTTYDNQYYQSVTGLTGGGFVVTWESWSDSTAFDVYAQIYDSTGSKVGGEFIVNTYTSGWQNSCSVAALSDGGFVVTWGSDYKTDAVYGQIYNSTGLTVGSEFQLTSKSGLDQPSVSTLSNGDIVVASSNDDIYATVYDIISSAISLTGGTYTLADTSITTVTGSSLSDDLVLSRGNCTLTISAVENVTGSTATETVIFAAASTTTVLGVDILVGSSFGDAVTLGGGGAVIVKALETIVGSASTDFVQFGNIGNTTTVSGVETLMGGNGVDWITLGSAGATVSLWGIDILVGSGGTDVVTLVSGSTVIVKALETIIGSAATDFVTLGNIGNTTTLSGVEIIVGGTGIDNITLGGGTIIVKALETIVGSAATDFVTLGNIGNTTTLSAVEIIVGGTGIDNITLGGGTVIVKALETIVGSASTDFVQFGNVGNTTTVSGVEALTGGNGTDWITISSGATIFTGNAGADVITLQSGANTDRIIFASADDGSAAGNTGGYDTVNNFQSGTDIVEISGSLKSLVDTGNGTIAVSSRASGAVNAASDEVVLLTTTVSGSLTDTGFAAFRAALGNISSGSSSDSILVLANNSTQSGLYVITDNGDGNIAASEVKLIAVFDTMLGAADITS